MMRLVGAERDGHGDGTWSNCERQCERVEGAAENIGGIHFFLDFWAAVPFLIAFQHGPAIRNADETAAALHDGTGDSKELQDVGAAEEGADQQNKTGERALQRKA